MALLEATVRKQPLIRHNQPKSITSDVFRACAKFRFQCERLRRKSVPCNSPDLVTVILVYSEGELDSAVRVEYSLPSGALRKVETRKTATIELLWDSHRKSLDLDIATLVKLPLGPPLMVATARISEGRLSLRLPAVRLHPTTDACAVQVLLSDADPRVLLKLRDAVHACMARMPRKPLQPLSLNLAAPTTSCAHGSYQMKRKAASEPQPASSLLSAGSTGTMSRPACAVDSQKFYARSTMNAEQEKDELPPLTPQQQDVVDLAIAGKSIFFTGCAGTGKSLVLKHILRRLPAASTFVTAPTGLAACALGGTTLHAFAGVGRGSGGLDAAVRAASRHEARRRWTAARTLVIDEVSMLDGAFFDLLDAVARQVRAQSAPFGGLQLILCGDFHQLPPVAAGSTPRRFCFESSTWAACIDHCRELTDVHRQSDGSFVDTLAKIRRGAADAALLAELSRRCSKPVDVGGVTATQLFTHRADVEQTNAAELDTLAGHPVAFTARDGGSAPDMLGSGCPAPPTLLLKVGAQVMLTRNVSQRRGLVNGARGVVLRFAGSSNPLPVVRFANGQTRTIDRERWTIASGGRVLATRLQIPLELAWATSVHKCQGLTLDAVQVNLARAFEPGMAYVALSRVRSLEGLHIVGAIDPRALRAHPKVTAFYRSLEAAISKLSRQRLA